MGGLGEAPQARTAGASRIFLFLIPIHGETFPHGSKLIKIRISKNQFPPLDFIDFIE